MALGSEIVDFVGLDFLHNVSEDTGVGQITVMQDRWRQGRMRVLVKMIDAIRIEKRRPAFDAMHFIAFSKNFGQVCAILSGHASDKSSFQSQYLPIEIYREPLKGTPCGTELKNLSVAGISPSKTRPFPNQERLRMEYFEIPKARLHP